MFEFTNRRFQFLAYALSLKISVPGLRPQPEDFSRLPGRQELKIFEISLHKVTQRIADTAADECSQ